MRMQSECCAIGQPSDVSKVGSRIAGPVDLGHVCRGRVSNEYISSLKVISLAKNQAFGLQCGCALSGVAEGVIADQ